MNQKLALEDEILLLTKHLCAIASVSTDAGKENECAEFIFNYLSSIQPVSPLTIEVDLIPCEKDPWNRKASSRPSFLTGFSRTYGYPYRTL